MKNRPHLLLFSIALAAGAQARNDFWMCMRHAVHLSFGAADISHGIEDFNQNEMLTLVGGSTFCRGVQVPQNGWEKLRDGVAEGRNYIIVSAYVFDSSPRHEKKLLWRARMSTERQGVDMDDVLPALVAGGASLFGRQTDRPQFSTSPLRQGKVEIDAPTVV